MTDALTDQIRSIPLPPGWIQQFDSNANHHFWVDTNAKPARSIWTHPYEDEEYLKDHPQARDEVNEVRRNHQNQYQSHHAPPSGAPPPRAQDSKEHVSQGGDQRGAQKKKGFMEKMKDKAIGTKEEREQQKRIAEAQRQQRLAQLQQIQQQRMQAMQQQQMMYGQQGMYGQPGMHGQQMYGQPYGAPPMMMGGGGRRMGGGGGGMAMPLMGGLAGGMLLGAGMNSMMSDDCDHDGGGGDMGDMGGDDF